MMNWLIIKSLVDYIGCIPTPKLFAKKNALSKGIF